MKVLMVAEKPILADSIARILSNGRYTSRKGELVIKLCSMPLFL